MGNTTTIENVTETTTTTAITTQDNKQPTTQNNKRPEWMKDADAGACLLCGIDFFFLTRRKHHCRACGVVVCDDCSSFKIKIPRLGYNELVRVCDKCWVREPALYYRSLSNEELKRISIGHERIASKKNDSDVNIEAESTKNQTTSPVTIPSTTSTTSSSPVKSGTGTPTFTCADWRRSSRDVV